MAIVNEIKCARCDRKYSGVRSRCPYCGARRIGRGKYSENTDNSKGKMLISVLIMAAFTVAAGVLLFTTPPVDALEPIPEEDEPLLSDNIEDDIDRLPGIYAPAPDTTIDDPEPSPEPPPPIVVTNVQIRYGTGLAGAPHDPRELTQRLGQPIEFRARIEPPGLENEVEIIWESTNPDVFEAIPVIVDVGGAAVGVRVTGLSRGNAHLVLRVGDVEDRVLIRIS
ncbi:MAG: hypothetical protein FWC20_03260 [Oscillospiraceae bacterium]|nr:hypothetical protein [Oscillospiraceae bacterium]MCL2278410.1 hypothetical protein [Oscillospiraceae bacterium]